MCRGDNEWTTFATKATAGGRVALALWVEESGAAMPLFNIKCNNGTTVSVEAELTCKVLDFKELISPKVDVPAAQQRLIYSGKVLKDPETLESYNLKEGHTVHMANLDDPDGELDDKPFWREVGCLCLRCAICS